MYAFVNVIAELADISGAIIRHFYRRPWQDQTKSDQSPVTEADRKAEAAIRERIRNHFPDHGIYGEEWGEEKGSSAYRWVIDPIDGTKSFMIGRPIFGTLIALLREDIPVLGLIDQPILHERWIGGEGVKTTWNGKAASTRTTVTLAESIMATTDRTLFSDLGKRVFTTIEQTQRFTVVGGDCYNYALLASGMVDVVVEEGLKPHDFCALAPVIEAAGGRCTDWEGQNLTAASSGRVLAAGNPEHHKALVSLIAPLLG